MMRIESDNYLLHDYYRSSASFRVRIALNLKNLKYSCRSWNLRDNEHQDDNYRQLNSQGLVPALVTPGGEVLTQSLAIIEYLDAVHPLPGLIPEAPVAAALVRSIALRIACDVHPINNLRVLRYLSDPLGLDTTQVEAWVRHWITETFRSLEDDLRVVVPGSIFCFGDSPTLADICLVPQVANARRFNLDMGEFPRISEICSSAMELKAFSDAAPDMGRDFA